MASLYSVFKMRKKKNEGFKRNNLPFFSRCINVERVMNDLLRKWSHVWGKTRCN